MNITYLSNISGPVHCPEDRICRSSPTHPAELYSHLSCPLCMGFQAVRLLGTWSCLSQKFSMFIAAILWDIVRTFLGCVFSSCCGTGKVIFVDLYPMLAKCSPSGVVGLQLSVSLSFGSAGQSGWEL